MKNRRNYYRVLHVQPGAPIAIIRASYHTMMQRLRMHPDLGGDHARAVLINEAFEILSDPVRREAYDRTLMHAIAQQRARVIPVPPAVDRVAAPDTPACEFCGAHLRASSEWPDGTCATCGSPLRPARKYQEGETSRRSTERLQRQIPITFRRAISRAKAWSGKTENLSLNGLRFHSPVEIGIGERVSIDCEFCLAVAIVKSVRQDDRDAEHRWQCGAEYLTLRIKHDRGGLFSTTA